MIGGDDDNDNDDDGGDCHNDERFIGRELWNIPTDDHVFNIARL